jgi:hypothetical protein
MGITLCYPLGHLAIRKVLILQGGRTAWDDICPRCAPHRLPSYHVIPLLSFSQTTTYNHGYSFVGAPVRIDKDCGSSFCASIYFIYPAIFLSPPLQGYFVKVRPLHHLSYGWSTLHRCCRLPRSAISRRRALEVVGICQCVLATPRSLAHHSVSHGRF